MAQTAAIDLLTVPTITFRVLYCFVVLRHHRRQVVHFNITPNPTAQWAARQIMQAFPYDSTPRFLLRDRDGIYGSIFRRRVKNMGIEEILTAYRSPWQNPCAERLIGSIRRDCLDHVIVLNEAHFRRILTEYFRYYHQARAPVPGPELADPPASQHSARRQGHCSIVSRWFAPLLHKSGVERMSDPYRLYTRTLRAMPVIHSFLILSRALVDLNGAWRAPATIAIVWPPVIVWADGVFGMDRCEKCGLGLLAGAG